MTRLGGPASGQRIPDEHQRRRRAANIWWRFAGGRAIAVLAVAALVGLTGACASESADPTSTQGHIEVAVNVAGVNVPGTSALMIDDIALGVVPSGTSFAFGPYPLGDHELLLDVAANCTLAGSNPRTLTIVSGDTILTETTTYNLTCS